MTTQSSGVKKMGWTLSGNHIGVYLAGNLVGLVNTITSDEDYAPEPAAGIGNIHVIEYVPSQARYQITIDKMVLKFESLASVAGTQNGKGLWEDGYAVMNGFVFDIVAVKGQYPNPADSTSVAGSSGATLQATGASADSTTSRAYFKTWRNCSFARGSVSTRANAIVVENATFVCTEIAGMNTIEPAELLANKKLT